VCDWMLFGEGHCIVIDATNHAVKDGAAQGLASWDDYSEDVEAILRESERRASWVYYRVNRALLQQLSQLLGTNALSPVT
jgi:hypothetical protein